MLLRLSYALSENTPFYEGLRRPSVEQLYGLEHGHECNSYYLTTSNHAGTHVDAPNHFNPAGRKITDYSADELCFCKPAIAAATVPDDRLLLPDHLQDIENVPKDCDMLLLRTDFSRFRTSAPKVYVEQGPGFSPAAAEYIMDTLPHLRALGMDFISASSLLHEKEGAEAHRVFLGCKGYSDRSILLVEDMQVLADLKQPKRILVVPWMMEGLDSAPCTVLAEL